MPLTAKELADLTRLGNAVDAMNVKHFFKMVLFGDYDAGKTTWAAQFGKTKYLSADPGIKSLQNHPGLAANCNVEMYRGPKHWDLLTRAIAAKEVGYDYDTLVIDTMSHIQEAYVMQLVKDSSYEGGKARERVIWNKPELRIQGDPMELPGSPDWNRAKFFFSDGILRLCREYEGNVIFIAHEREPGWMEKAEEKKGNKTAQENAVRPSITESLFKVIAREVDLIAFMERNGDKRTIQCHKTRNTVGKSRIKELSGAQKFPAQEVSRILNEWRTRPRGDYPESATGG